MHPSQDTTYNGTHCGTVAVYQPNMHHMSASAQIYVAKGMYIAATELGSVEWKH